MLTRRCTDAQNYTAEKRGGDEGERETKMRGGEMARKRGEGKARRETRGEARGEEGERKRRRGIRR